MLKFFQSYLSTRSQCVSISSVLLECSELVHHVPQGYVLSPILFCIYIMALGTILRNYNIKYYIYVDDTQLYCSFDLKSPLVAIEKIQSCISDIRFFMTKNKLKISDDEVEFLITSHANFSRDF